MIKYSEVSEYVNKQRIVLIPSGFMSLTVCWLTTVIETDYSFTNLLHFTTVVEWFGNPLIMPLISF